MTGRTEILRALLDDGPEIEETLLDRVGIAQRAGEALISNLAREGAVKRMASGRVSIANRPLAEKLAAEATRGALHIGGEIPAPLPRAPITLAPAPAPPAPATTSGRKPRAAAVHIPLAGAVEVRKGIPLPQAPGRQGKPCPWPFASMDPGDSFVVDVPAGYTPKQLADRLRSNVDVFRKRHPGRRFAIRTLDDGKQIGVWREADTAAAPAMPGKRKAAA